MKRSKTQSLPVTLSRLPAARFSKKGHLVVKYFIGFSRINEIPYSLLKEPGL